jgi:hypothetical protein
MSGGSNPRKKGATGGLFSTLSGITKLGSEEDGFEVIDNELSRGKNNVEIKMSKLNNESSHRNVQHGSISVQRDWSVFVDERKDKNRL